MAFPRFIYHNLSLNIIWALPRENLSSGVFKQHRRRPACASAQSYQHICYSLFKSAVCKLAAGEILISLLVSLADETSLKLTLLDTPKTGFLTTRPILLMYFSLTQTDQLLVHLQSFSTNAVHYNVPESVKNGVPLFYLPQPTSLVPSLNIILLMYFSLTQTDQLLVHLQSFFTDAVHYNVPESVKNGVPLFYLPQPTSIEPSLNIILLMYFSLTQTDQLLVHLQSISTNAVHYNVPESVKNGVPLFYLPQPTSIVPSLNIILFICFSLSQTDQLLVHLQSFSTNAVHYNVPESVKNGVPLFYLPQPTSIVPSLNIIWASKQENLSLGVCEQHRRRPACASVQSDQHLCYSFF